MVCNGNPLQDAYEQIEKLQSFIRREMEDAAALCLLYEADPDCDNLREFAARCEVILKG